MALIASTDLDVFPLCFGGNIFGWTVGREAAFTVLDAYTRAGGNFVDTADAYPAWAPGCTGGESETIIGEWLRARGNRADVVLATKVGLRPKHEGLAPANIRRAVETSLERLQTDWIDIYYAHADDQTVPLVEALAAFDGLVRAGTVRYIAVANFTPARLAEALAVSERDGLARYVAVQNHYNLVERDYEVGTRELALARGLSSIPYYGLAQGFLTGKYRPGMPAGDSPRAPKAAAYLNERGERVLAELDAIAAAHETTVAAVSLAWLAAQPTVISPIASARTPEQLADLLPMADLALSGDEISRLDTASS